MFPTPYSGSMALADSDRLFGPADDAPIALDAGAWLLPGWAAGQAQRWVDSVREVLAQAPWRTMRTPGGLPMSVAMSHCGSWGWVSDASGYAYSATDPHSGLPWPAMPEWLWQQARAAATAAGYPQFAPDSCLINRYVAGAKMSLHRDADESDTRAPIVSISLGLPATFLWGGVARADRVRRMQLEHGDVLVWGGATRLAYHGISPLRDGMHPLLGSERWNLTFRMARALYPQDG